MMHLTRKLTKESLGSKNLENQSTCDICKSTTNHEGHVLFYGEWMEKQGLKVHYYCLLLSTNLPQNGSDACGILGFLIRDIRHEIKESDKRKCCFCRRNNASIQCHKCKKYFHLICGYRSSCRFEFIDAFHSYCVNCAPLDNFQKQTLKKRPENITCKVCHQIISVYNPQKVLHGSCCNTGFVHRLCMQQTALASGYYLRCIFCRNTDFRDHVRRLGVFVPDRDANWERDLNAFSDLYRKLKRCEWNECCCPYGREFTKSNWSLAICILCGAFAAHRQCIGGGVTKQRSSKIDVEEFKCSTCCAVEKKIEVNKNLKHNFDDSILDTSIYMHKIKGQNVPDETSSNSDEDTISNSSVVTVLASQQKDESICKSPRHQKDKKKGPKATKISLEPGNVVIIDQSSGPLEGNISQSRLELFRYYRLKHQPYFFVEFYIINASITECIGICILRYDQNDLRITDKSKWNLENLAKNQKAKDFYKTISYRGNFEKVDTIIDAVLNSN